MKTQMKQDEMKMKMKLGPVDGQRQKPIYSSACHLTDQFA